VKQRIRALLLPACAAHLLAGAASAQTQPAPDTAPAPAIQTPAGAEIEPRVNTSAPAQRAPARGAARTGATRTNPDHR
jgi:cytoskeletal protein RodZ